MIDQAFGPLPPNLPRENWRETHALWKQPKCRTIRRPLLVELRYGIRDLDAPCNRITLGLKRYLDQIWPWETNDDYPMRVKFTHNPDFETPYYEGQFADFHFIYAQGQSRQEVLDKLIDQFESWMNTTVDINLDHRHLKTRFR